MARVTAGKGGLYLGIDGGGSKTRAVLVDGANQVLGTGLAGPANPFHGVEQTFTSILLATELALEDAGLPASQRAQLVVGAGLAGVNLPSLFEVMAKWDHPFQQFFLTTDLHIACLGAHAGEEGAVIIAGTGSCGYAHVGQQTLIIGGHGFPFGDKGSGAWLGLEAVKHALLAADGLAPSSLLAERVALALGARGIELVARLTGARSSDYARLAPLVLDAADAGDLVCEALVQEGADYLSAVARKLLGLKPPRLAMLGGVSARLQHWMDDDLVARVCPALLSPELGAVHFARQQLLVLEKSA